MYQSMLVIIPGLNLDCLLVQVRPAPQPLALGQLGVHPPLLQLLRASPSRSLQQQAVSGMKMGEATYFITVQGHSVPCSGIYMLSNVCIRCHYS